MKLSISHFLFIVISSVFLYIGCDDSTNPFFRETDFSTVPAPLDTSESELIELENGLSYYIVDRGDEDSQWQVQGRDGIRIFLTLRLEDGTILQSTYANGRTTPEDVGVASLSPQGLREGVLGMKEGESRVIIVPPSLGYGNVNQGQQFYQLRDETLIYDVELEAILE